MKQRWVKAQKRFKIEWYTIKSVKAATKPHHHDVALFEILILVWVLCGDFAWIVLHFNHSVYH